MITTYRLWDEFGPTQVITTDLSDILTISRVYGDCAQGNPLNNSQLGMAGGREGGSITYQATKCPTRQKWDIYDDSIRPR